MYKLTLYTFVFATLSMFCTYSTFANPANEQHQDGKPAQTDSAQETFDKVIDEYKAHAASISLEVKNEIVNYRKEVANLNKQKKALYKKLSNQAQEYLRIEQKFRKKLPLDYKKRVAIETGSKNPA